VDQDLDSVFNILREMKADNKIEGTGNGNLHIKILKG
jgi:hypothetical protein